MSSILASYYGVQHRLERQDLRLHDLVLELTTDPSCLEYKQLALVDDDGFANDVYAVYWADADGRERAEQGPRFVRNWRELCESPPRGVGYWRELLDIPANRAAGLMTDLSPNRPAYEPAFRPREVADRFGRLEYHSSRHPGMAPIRQSQLVVDGRSSSLPSREWCVVQSGWAHTTRRQVPVTTPRSTQPAQASKDHGAAPWVDRFCRPACSDTRVLWTITDSAAAAREWVVRHPFQQALAPPGARAQLWHEVYLLPEGGQHFEYVNCSARVGVSRATSRSTSLAPSGEGPRDSARGPTRLGKELAVTHSE